VTDHPTPPELSFIDDPAGVADALATLDGEVLGIDVERADSDRYFRRAALVQVGVAGRCVLLDTVAIDALPDLDARLDGDHLAVLHAIENDLGPLRSLGVHPERVADTAIAAAMLGLPTGLSNLLTEVVGVELAGDKESFQRADWELRPLSAGMAAYAAGDVVHLPALWAELSARLERTGRRAWYDEELAATLDREDEYTRDWTRVKGSGRLDPRQRAVLRALWEARESEAREHDIAPNRLIHDDVLRDLAVDPPRTQAQLVRRSPRRRGLLREHAEALFDAVGAAAQAPPEDRPRSSRWTENDRAVHDALRIRRAGVAEEIGIDAGILCPSKPLWNVVAGDPADGEELCALAELSAWQTSLLAEPLWEAYREVRDGGEADADADATTTRG